jgi:hypothetical protein
MLLAIWYFSETQSKVMEFLSYFSSFLEKSLDPELVSIVIGQVGNLDG